MIGVMRCLKLYSPAIVVGVWAVLWAAGVHGDTLIVVALTLLTVAIVIAELERSAIRRAIRRHERR